MKIRIHAAGEVEWTRIGDLSSEPGGGLLTEGELNSLISFPERGDATSPQLMEVRYLPGAFIVPHAHDTAEIIYVVEGELRFGDRVLGPGASIYIAAGAVYSYRAGAAGLRIVNFRPHADFSFRPAAARPAEI